MGKKLLLVVLLGAVFLTAGAQAPTATPSAMGDALRFLQGYNRKNILAAAEMVGEASYGFRPTPAVRTFGELVGHIADVQYLLCSTVKGEPNPAAAEPKASEPSQRTKAKLLAALRASFDYCETVYAGIDDAGLARTPAGADSTNAASLTLNLYHAGQHYGNMVTYLRIQGLVPPSSQEAGQRPPEKPESGVRRLPL